MDSLKQNTKDLILSFRYRREAFLPRKRNGDRAIEARWYRKEKELKGSKLMRECEISFLQIRKHLMEIK